MPTILAAIFPVFALIGAGGVFGRVRKVGPGGVAVLNGFTVWLALPALLFRSLAAGDWKRLDQPGFVLAFGGGAALTFLIGYLVTLRGHHGGEDRSLAALAGSYANIAFIGIPLVGGLMGSVGTEAGVLASLIRNPLILAPIAGGLWAAIGIAIPAALDRLLTLLAGAASPTALVTIGAFLALPGRRADPAPLARSLALKLLLQPAITALIVLFVPIPRDWAIAAILLAALPTGTGPFMLAELYGREAALASRAILISTVVGAFTIAMLARILL